MPVLEAVLDDPPVKGVLVAAICGPEVSVAGVVGLLVGRHVAHHLLELQERRVKMAHTGVSSLIKCSHTWEGLPN